MSNQIPLLQVFLNTVSKMLAHVGLDRQLMIDTETYRLYVHDGVTKGGHPLKKLDDPTEEIRAIKYKGRDPVAGETWVMGEWPSDDDPQVMEPAYIAGAVGSDIPIMSDDDIALGTSEVPALPNAKQLAGLGGAGNSWQSIWLGSTSNIDGAVKLTETGEYRLKGAGGWYYYFYWEVGTSTVGVYDANGWTGGFNARVLRIGNNGAMTTVYEDHGSNLDSKQQFTSIENRV